jgi:uncharacterized RDD family membrane protein YckC
MDPSYLIEEHRAAGFPRFWNYLIDLVTFYLFFLGTIMISGIVAYPINPYSTWAEDLDNLNPFVDRILSALAYGIFMFFIEWITKGRSLGKYITGTEVLMEDGTKPTVGMYFKRNICRIVPFDAFSYFGFGRGWHDQWSDTYVVHKKGYQDALGAEQSVQEIGTSEEI